MLFTVNRCIAIVLSDELNSLLQVFFREIAFHETQIEFAFQNRQSGIADPRQNFAFVVYADGIGENIKFDTV